MSSGRKIPQGTLTIVGLATVVLAVLGLWYNYSTLLLDYSSPLEQSSKKHDVTDFYPIFYTMSVICVVFYVLRGSTDSEKTQLGFCSVDYCGS
jgi:hypothetical protein